MNKEEFLNALRSNLKGLPSDEIEERISFYDEMIEDIMEEGKTEEEAVESIGDMGVVVSKIADDTKMSSLVKERMKPRRSIRAWEVILIVLGFPIWLPFVIVFGVLVFVFFVLMFILVIVTYAVELSLLGYGGMAILAGLQSLRDGAFQLGDFAIALLAFGVALIFINVCVLATKAQIRLIKGIVRKIKAKMIGGRKNA
ncbi:MAG: DUF1700 domain-containing protein [Acholeplasmatales bacterium]|nr:DUF1700 domain-containing protein [Acholeplasmatales bacterium]